MVIIIPLLSGTGIRLAIAIADHTHLSAGPIAVIKAGVTEPAAGHASFSGYRPQM